MSPVQVATSSALAHGLLKALADPVRLQIIEALASESAAFASSPLILVSLSPVFPST